jgi:hypothetical protein
MTVSFNPLKANGQLFTHLPELNDLELSLSNANAADVLDALGIEAAFSAGPWPLPRFKALLVVARRKRIGHASPAIPLLVPLTCFLFARVRRSMTRSNPKGATHDIVSRHHRTR